MSDYFIYRDEELYGQLDDVIERASFNYWVFVKKPEGVDPEGKVIYSKRRFIIRGSLQTWTKQTTYGEDSNPNISKRDGKLYTKYNVKLNIGDIIMKNNDRYRITDLEDFDYGGVRQYHVTRLGHDEITEYNFDDYREERFDDK